MPRSIVFGFDPPAILADPSERPGERGGWEPHPPAAPPASESITKHDAPRAPRRRSARHVPDAERPAKRLSVTETRFVDAVLAGCTQAEAARRAGSRATRPREAGFEMAARPHVAAEIRRRLAERTAGASAAVALTIAEERARGESRTAERILRTALRYAPEATVAQLVTALERLAPRSRRTGPGGNHVA